MGSHSQQNLSGTGVPVRVWTDDIDAQCAAQLRNIASLPFIFHHVAAMPDVHLGKGATVGSVIPTRGAIIPAAVGVDIGCGMNAVRTSLTAADLPENLRSLRHAIEARIPVGFEQHGRDGAHDQDYRPLHDRLETILARHPDIRPKRADKPVCQLGTLGGGNHFVEICLDEADRVWVMLHSGSRGIGNQIGTYFIERARTAMGDALGQLPDRDLAYLTEGDDAGLFRDYIDALEWAQSYARENRRVMMREIVAALAASDALPPFELTSEAVNCHHNYTAVEHHFGEQVYVTRKGAINAAEGVLGIIPGSMGSYSYIVRGKGNPEAFNSCAHGAGRRMSRGQARRSFSRADLQAQTEGVECRKDKGVIDEIPGAYKDIDTVMASQTDLVETIHRLRQVICVKG